MSSMIKKIFSKLSCEALQDHTPFDVYRTKTGSYMGIFKLPSDFVDGTKDLMLTSREKFRLIVFSKDIDEIHFCDLNRKPVPMTYRRVSYVKNALNGKSVGVCLMMDEKKDEPVEQVISFQDYQRSMSEKPNANPNLLSEVCCYESVKNPEPIVDNANHLIVLERVSNDDDKTPLIDLRQIEIFEDKNIEFPNSLEKDFKLLEKLVEALNNPETPDDQNLLTGSLFDNAIALTMLSRDIGTEMFDVRVSYQTGYAIKNITKRSIFEYEKFKLRSDGVPSHCRFLLPHGPKSDNQIKEFKSCMERVLKMMNSPPKSNLLGVQCDIERHCPDIHVYLEKELNADMDIDDENLDDNAVESEEDEE